MKFNKITKETFNSIKIGDFVGHIKARSSYNIYYNEQVILVRNSVVKEILPLSQLKTNDVVNNNFDIEYNRFKMREFIELFEIKY